MIKLFFNYKVLKCDRAKGLKINFFSLFCITFTAFGFEGKRYMDKKGLFNLDISFQFTPKLWKQRFFPNIEEYTKDWVSLCRNCGPMVKHFAEHWVVGQSGPYMIEFIEYDDSAKPRLIDTVTLEEKQKGKSVKYLTCMKCHDMVVKMPIEQVKSMMGERVVEKI